jgi:SNF2 family DNA or RNA helicase
MKRAMRWLLQHPAAGLILDPGLRKTSITLGAFKVMLNKGILQRMLVVAPIKVCYRVWPKEIRKWADFNGLRLCILHGRDKTEENLARDDIDIFCINPEGLDWLFPGESPLPKLATETKDAWRARNKAHQKETRKAAKRRSALLFAPGGTMLTVDESSKFKNSSTQRFKRLKPFLPRFQRRAILTGSPSPNGLLDLFGQIYILDLGRSLGQYITQYRKKYFSSVGFGGYSWVLKEDDSEQQIYKAVKPYLIRFQAEDFMDLPELIENDIVIDLPEKVRKNYDELEEDLITMLESGVNIEAPTGGAALAKCAQIANGAVYLNPEGGYRRKKSDYAELHDEKLYALEDYLEERSGQPTLVTYEFHHDLIRIRNWFRHAYPALVREWGDIPCISTASEKVGQRMEDAWNDNQIPFMLGQPQSISHGLNMQGGNADAIALFSPMYDYDNYDQLIRRLRRSGNTSRRIIVTRFIARNTVDRLKILALVRKGRTQQRFMDALKTYKTERRQ